jgi:hypothetical protein
MFFDGHQVSCCRFLMGTKSHSAAESVIDGFLTSDKFGGGGDGGGR